jgi:hypothetical protein
LPESKTYQEKLLDPRWQKKRLEIFERDQWTCQSCLATDKTLHVHHRFYRPDREPWEYEDIALITLCKDCHEFEPDELKQAIAVLLWLIETNGLISKEVKNLTEIIYRCEVAGDLTPLLKLKEIVPLPNKIQVPDQLAERRSTCPKELPSSPEFPF